MKILNMFVAVIIGMCLGAFVEHIGSKPHRFHGEAFHVAGWWDAYSGSSIETGNQKILYDDSGHRFWADSFQYEVGVGLHCILWREADQSAVEPDVVVRSVSKSPITLTFEWSTNEVDWNAGATVELTGTNPTTFMTNLAIPPTKYVRMVKP